LSASTDSNVRLETCAILAFAAGDMLPNGWLVGFCSTAVYPRLDRRRGKLHMDGLRRLGSLI
jgi:hypothetical protein